MHTRRLESVAARDGRHAPASAAHSSMATSLPAAGDWASCWTSSPPSRRLWNPARRLS